MQIINKIVPNTEFAGSAQLEIVFNPFLFVKKPQTILTKKL